jgi:uncharacterized membrane protein YhaH (DUF805 family)
LKCLSINSFSEVSQRRKQKKKLFFNGNGRMTRKKIVWPSFMIFQVVLFIFAICFMMFLEAVLIVPKSSGFSPRNVRLQLFKVSTRKLGFLCALRDF